LISDLHDAIEIISERLKESDIHWSVLCCHLVWPNHFLITLQNIIKNTQQNKTSSDTQFPLLLQEKSDEQKHPLSSKHFHFGSEMASMDKVIDFVKFSVQGTEKEQCLFMLKLWLHHSDQQASLEQLVKALQASRMSDAATKLTKLSSR